NRPEANPGNILNGQTINRLAIVLPRLSASVKGRIRGVTAQARGRANQMLDRIDLLLPPEHPGRINSAVGGCETQECLTNPFELRLIPFGYLKAARLLLIYLDGILQRMNCLNISRVARVHERPDCQADV